GSAGRRSGAAGAVAGAAVPDRLALRARVGRRAGAGSRRRVGAAGAVAGAAVPELGAGRAGVRRRSGAVGPGAEDLGPGRQMLLGRLAADLLVAVAALHAGLTAGRLADAVAADPFGGPRAVLRRRASPRAGRAG